MQWRIVASFALMLAWLVGCGADDAGGGTATTTANGGAAAQGGSGGSGGTGASGATGASGGAGAGGAVGGGGGGGGAVGEPFRVVGYFPSWVEGESQIQFEYLTHINYAFILPTSSGGLTGLSSTAQLDSLVGLAHANGITVCISVGGWNDGDDSAFHALAADAGTRTAFVANVVAFVADHHLDGADIDWEYPDAGASADDYGLLMAELSAALHSDGKLLTAAVVAGPYAGDGINDSVFGVVDYLNLMAYDGGTPHSPYSLAEQSLSYWTGRGLPRAKAVLGVPFYGRDPYTPYHGLVDMDPAAPSKDQVGDIHYNGIATIQAKTALAATEGSGIMAWELSQDTLDDTSLLRAIHTAIPVGWTMP